MYFIYLIIIIFFNLLTQILYVSEKFIDRTLPEDDFYDYIVVGSGSAGGLIASELKGKVLLLEAGSYGCGVLFNIPMVQPMLLRSQYDWKYETIPQKDACMAMNDKKSFWPAGKIISGTHRLNNMIYHRGHIKDYEGIVDENTANKYFDEVESKIPVSETNFKSKISQAFIAGAKTLGFDDFDHTKLTQFHGRRYTQINNWWRKSSKVPETVLNAIVVKIIFKGKRAVGVKFFKNGKYHQAFGKNIVLSSGTMGTPKILLHSGVGPKKLLNDLKIDVIEDLPVGDNLQDHVTSNIELLLNEKNECSIQEICNPIKIFKYMWSGNGPLSLSGSDAVGFLSFNASSDYPDFSFIFLPVGITDDYGLHLRKTINIRDDIWQKYYEPLAAKPIATILPILLHPKSKGNIRIKSSDFDDPLLIDPKYYESKDDVQSMIKAIRIIQKLIETPSMKTFKAELIPKSLPDCEHLNFDSDDYWECYIRHLTFTMYHPIGTCKMGDYDDQNTVVLKNFQVKNLENLYVVDGSVIPNASSANPHALISMLAQKFIHEMNMINDND